MFFFLIFAKKKKFRNIYYLNMPLLSEKRFEKRKPFGLKILRNKARYIIAPHTSYIKKKKNVDSYLIRECFTQMSCDIYRRQYTCIQCI